MTPAEESRCLVENKGLVKGIAWRYRKFGVPLEDLEQEGLIGLLKAARKYRHVEGVGSLRAFAIPVIRNHIRRHIGTSKNGSLRLSAEHWSMDREDSNEQTLHDYVPSPGKDPEALYAEKEQVERLLSVLTDKELAVIRHRFAGTTTRETGKAVDMSNSRVEQLETIAMAKMRKASRRAA